MEGGRQQQRPTPNGQGDKLQLTVKDVVEPICFSQWQAQSHFESTQPVEFQLSSRYASSPIWRALFPFPPHPAAVEFNFQTDFPCHVRVCVEMHISNCNRHNFGLAMGNHLEVLVTTTGWVNVMQFGIRKMHLQPAVLANLYSLVLN